MSKPEDVNNCLKEGVCPDPQVTTLLRAICRDVDEIKSAIKGEPRYGNKGIIPRLEGLEDRVIKLFIALGILAGGFAGFEYIVRIFKR